jgi:hypothetical protein
MGVTAVKKRCFEVSSLLFLFDPANGAVLN